MRCARRMNEATDHVAVLSDAGESLVGLCVPAQASVVCDAQVLVLFDDSGHEATQVQASQSLVLSGDERAFAHVEHDPLRLGLAEPHPRLHTPPVEEAKSVGQVDIVHRVGLALTRPAARSASVDERRSSRLDGDVVGVELDIETGTGRRQAGG